MHKRLIVAVVFLLFVAACGDDASDESSPTTTTSTKSTTATTTTTAPPAEVTTSTTEAVAAPVLNPYGDYVSDTYAGGANWLCHPLAADSVCDADLDTTFVYPDGTAEVVPHVAAEEPAVDCFYVYPTISNDPAGNSDFEVNPLEEAYATRNQAARYSQFCRVFAPVYRSTTLTNMLGRLTDEMPAVVDGLADGDVLDAWKHYIANDNDGRGVLLVGHSQGSGRLATLIRSEIADTDVESLIVGAHLIVGGPNLPLDSDTPDDFGSIPMCTTDGQFGCLTSYASFRDDHAFDPQEGEPTSRDVCVNPAAVEGGPAVLTPYYPTQVNELVAAALGPAIGPWDDPARIEELTTPFYTMIDLVEAECVEVEGNTVLVISVLADPDNPQADDIHGDIPFLPDFGLHFVDMSLAQGDLVNLGEAQANAWLANQ